MNDIVDKRWAFTRSELKKFQKWYSKQNKKTQDKIQEIINYYDLSFEELNKTISNVEKERLNRKIEEWISIGIYIGYFKYRVEELMKNNISYRSLIEILLYGIYMEEQQIISNEINTIYSNIALDCYNQGKKDLKQEKVDKIPKLLLETLYGTLIDGIIFLDYLNALYLTNLQEIQKQYLISIQQNSELDVYSNFMQRQFEKQRNRLISVNDDKFSGGLDKYATALGNLAYIEAGGNDNQKVKLVSDSCDNETEMCSYLNGMIFNTKDRNIFERPMGKSVKELTMQRVDILGLVVGINQPPISEHFHWCHSILTFQIDKSADELRNEIFFKNFDEYYDLSDTEIAQLKNEAQEAINMLPKHIRYICKDTKFKISDEGVSKYVPKDDIIYLKKNADKYSVIHEIGHVLDEKLDIFNDKKFVDIINSKFKKYDKSDFELVSYNSTIKLYHLKNYGEFVSKYQTTLYPISQNKKSFTLFNKVNAYNAKEYFSEGLKYYFSNPKLLKEKDSRLFEYIDEMMEEFK